MIAVVRRPAPAPTRARPAESKKHSGTPPGKPAALQPAGQRTGSGASSVLPYLSLPR